jgi:hypothetical protein
MVAPTDTERFYNMLERIEMVLESIRLELEIARIDRGEVIAPNTDRMDAMGQLQAAERALNDLRHGE